MRYAFIDEQRTQHCVRRMRNLLHVSTAGYYQRQLLQPMQHCLIPDCLSSSGGKQKASPTLNFAIRKDRTTA